MPTEFEQQRRRIEHLEAELIAVKEVHAESLATNNLNVRGSNIFDRHGAVAIVFAILIQTGGAIWWASSINTRIEAFEKQQLKQDEILHSLSMMLESNAERLTRVQVVQENVVKILDELSHRAMRGPDQ